MHRAVATLCLFAGAALATLVVAEAVLRLAGLAPGEASRHFQADSDTRWSEPDPELGWRNRPGEARSLECGRASMSFREDGSRNSPSEPDAPAATLFFGGSYAQGYGVPDDTTFVELLNRDAPGSGYRSYGTGGYNTLQSRLLAERVLDGRPGGRPVRVVYAFIDAHLKRNVADASFVLNLRIPGGRFMVPPHQRIGGDAGTQRPASHIEAWPGAQRLALALLVQRAGIIARYRVDDDERLRVSRRLVEEFAAAMRARDTPFRVVLFESSDAAQDAVFGGVSPAPIDCRFEDRPELSVCGDGSGHPGPEVHAHWARCIRSRLTGV